jgi:hypothetical protein
MQKFWFGRTARPNVYAFGIRSFGITFDRTYDKTSYCVWYRKSKSRLGYKYGSI